MLFVFVFIAELSVLGGRAFFSVFVLGSLAPVSGGASGSASFVVLVFCDSAELRVSASFRLFALLS